MKTIFLCLRKTSAFGKKFETPQLDILPLPGQSKGWTWCVYHLAQSWMWCWLFGFLCTERAKLQVSLSLGCCEVSVSGCTPGRGGWLQECTLRPAVHPGSCTPSNTAQGGFEAGGWRLHCQKESLIPSVQARHLCEPAQGAPSEERDGALSHFLPRLPTTVLGNLYL